MVEKVDAFAHVLPKEFYEEINSTASSSGGGAESSEREQQLSEAPHLWDMEMRLDALDDHGIDRQVLTLAYPPVWKGIDPTDARPLVELANDEVARIADEHPERFIPVGTLPYPTADYVDEFDRCIDDLGMVGIQLFSNIDGRPLDDEAFNPVFRRADETGTPIWLHPQLHDWYDWMEEYMDHKMLGWPFDTSVALSRLIFSGTLDAFPDLNIVTHHMGGMLPFFGGRMLGFYESRRQYPDVFPGIDWPDFSRPIESYFDQLYGDTVVTGSKAALRCGLEFFGSENVLFATDYPFGPDEGRAWMAETLDAIDGLGLSEADQQRVYAGTVTELIGE